MIDLLRTLIPALITTDHVAIIMFKPTAKEKVTNKITLILLIGNPTADVAQVMFICVILV